MFLDERLSLPTKDENKDANKDKNKNGTTLSKARPDVFNQAWLFQMSTKLEL